MRTAFSALATALFTLFVPLVVAVWIPQRMMGGISLNTTAPLVFRSIGALLFALGVAGYLWSVLAVVFGQALFHRSSRVAWYGLFLFACFHLFVVLYEERALRAQFNGEYEELCRRVGRWWPRRPRRG